jgi:hypothetical protein
MNRSLFDESEPLPVCDMCGRDVVGAACEFCRTKLARNTDPATSHAAAASLDHKLKTHHLQALAWLGLHGPRTDDEIAQGLVHDGIAKRTETARRWVRTLREEHGMIVPALDDKGAHIERVNDSGRAARAWRTTP